MGSDFRDGFCQMDMLVDMVDPGNGDEMMMISVGRTLLGQLDLVGILQMIDLADRLLVR
jgi:hypothetical protein